MEDAKQRSRRDAEDRRSDRDRGREREKEHHRRAAEKERERDRDRERERERERDRGGASEKHVSSSSRHRDKEKESARNSRHREDHKPSRDAEREKQRSKTKDKDRDDRYNKADRDRDRERDHERERDRERDRDRDRERKRRHIRDSDSEDDFERKRRKREDSRTSVRDRYKDEDSRSPARERDRVRERERHRDDGDTDREIERNLGADDEDEGRRASASVSAKRKSDESENEEEKEAREKKKKEDMEEEQRKLFEHIEKRRRRVQEWQEMRRLKEESDKVQPSEQAQVGRKWTLEGDDSDDDVDEANAKANGDAKSNAEGVLAAADDAQDKKTHNGGDPMTVDGESSNAAAAADEEEIDPLDAFMNTLVVPDMDDSQKPPQSDNSNSKDTKPASKIGFNKPSKNGLGRIIPGEGSDDENEVVDEDEENIEDEDDDEFMRRVKKSKVEKLSIVDHSKVQYMAFRKDFYREVKEIALMTPDDVAQYRKQLELKIRGKDVPKPIKTWNQTGLTRNVLEIIKKLGFEKPMSIQAQALPAIMSGRDCIGVAKTGSGKTLAFVLPMLRHIKDQPPLGPGDGPIGLVMAPTRELVQQIHSDIKKFTKVLGLNCVPVYGGSGVAQQISELKRGTEVVVCTPGRMIDILCTSGGKITNLKRVTYLVMDEADRMFDMGFEPQITRIVQNTRPDRQTVLFSATFPRQVETLARKVLNKPVEIQVGGRSVVNKDITQTIEVRLEGERFLRLLEILGEWYEKGKILVFVHTQDKCDNLFKDLLRHGYPCLSLHGAKDQTDRESTISDFKSNVCNLLIATSVAARGLDVKELELVVNYDAPNHYEDYVHRVGRTGRAGRKGFAITFISQEEERYAPDLVKALELSEQPIPQDLKTLADGFMAKVSQGTEHAHGTGYGGSGFKFNEEEEEARKAAKKAQAREYGYEEYDKSDSEDEDEGIRKAGGDIAHAAALVQAAALAAATKSTIPSLPLSSNTAAVANPATTGLPVESWVSGVQTVPGLAGSLPMAGLPGTFSVPNDAAARAAAFAAALNLQHNLAKIQKDAMPEHYEAELEINDFPQNARWKVTHKETLGPISEWTGAAITTRGQYYPPGKIPGPGERKLYLFIEGPTESSVKKAKAEVKRVLEDYTAQAISLSGSVQPGKYSVL